ncbi:MAG TPA: Maf family protein [Thermodesulfovibrionales bacterium]|nr:Maf family protein [Thermodesulfovibrionales bacterium]
MKLVVLASASPRRKEILGKTGLFFKVDAGRYEENIPSGLRPRSAARFLSAEKAQVVAGRYENALVIAADTFIVFRKRILGKPRTAAEAKRMLTLLNGKTHSVITGFTIFDTKTRRKLSRSVVTKVFFRRLTRGEIAAYVESGEPLDKAGAYGIQGFGSAIVRKIEGDYFNVVGFPLSAVVEGLKKFGIDVMKRRKKC